MGSDAGGTSDVMAERRPSAARVAGAASTLSMDPIAQASLDRVLAAVEAERALSEDLREHAKVLDRAQRKVCVQLGQVHALPLSQVPAHLEVVAASMRDVREALAQLAAQVPAHEFYRVCVCC